MDPSFACFGTEANTKLWLLTLYRERHGVQNPLGFITTQFLVWYSILPS
jgi:hypothetical protein